MDEIEVVLKRFGDEQSTLLDQFERLSFEVQLNQAILARSLSEPGFEAGRTRVQHPLTLRDHIADGHGEPPAVVEKQGKGTTAEKRRRIGSGFNRFFKKLLKPILGRKKVNREKDTADNEEEVLGPKFCKAFSRSVRF
ncbi:hypothetical protein LINPERHAP1_LOCUS12065 [Linum perenne]